MVIATVLSGIIQVLVFAFIPFIVYLVTARRQRRFAEYIGLKRAPARAAGWGVLIGMASFPLMLGLLHVAGAADVLADPASQTGRLRELAEARGVAAMLFVAVFQAAVTTALSEEILFRGFLAKRLVSRLGFGAGNTLQALVFGAVHSVLLTGTATETSGPSPAVWAAVVLLPAVQGWLMGWLNERLAGGSIVPGWCAHAVSNALTFTVVPILI